MKKFRGMITEGHEGALDLKEVVAYYEGWEDSNKKEPTHGTHTTVILKNGVKLTVRGAIWNFRKDMKRLSKIRRFLRYHLRFFYKEDKKIERIDPCNENTGKVEKTLDKIRGTIAYKRIRKISLDD